MPRFNAGDLVLITGQNSWAAWNSSGMDEFIGKTYRIGDSFSSTSYSLEGIGYSWGEQCLQLVQDYELRVGDVVKILGRNSWSGWVPDMDEFIGQEVIINRISVDGNYLIDGWHYGKECVELVQVHESNLDTSTDASAITWSEGIALSSISDHLDYSAFTNMFDTQAQTSAIPSPSLSYTERQALSGIHEGDQVIVTRSAQEGEQGWRNSWVDRMDSFIGEECTVLNSGDVRGFDVSINPNGRSFGFPYFVLQKVELEAPKPEKVCKKVYKIDESLHFNPLCTDSYIFRETDHFITKTVRIKDPRLLWNDQNLKNLATEPYPYTPATTIVETKSIYKEIPPEVQVLMFKYGFIPPSEHFLHIPIHDKSKVSYTESEEKGERDRQAVQRIGRYLNKYSGMTEPQIAEISAVYRKAVLGEAEIKFARTREEIRHVYENGPSSCMGHGVYKFNTKVKGEKIHPCEVYATPDVSVAYMERDSRITARVVCNEIEKTFNNIYGDSVLFEPALRDLGYTVGDLEGCSLLLLRNDDGKIICPYIDGERSVTVYDDRLEVSSDGDYEASSEHGVLYTSTCTCSHCEDQFNEDDGRDIRGDFVCEGCLDENYTAAYTGSEYEYTQEDVYTYNHSWYTQEGLDYHALILLEDGNVISQEDAVWSEIDEQYYDPDDVQMYLTIGGDQDCTVRYIDRLVQPEDTDEQMLEEDCYSYEDMYFREEAARDEQEQEEETEDAA